MIKITKIQFWQIEEAIKWNKHLSIAPNVFMTSDKNGTYYKDENGYAATAILLSGKMVYKAHQKFIELIAK